MLRRLAVAVGEPTSITNPWLAPQHSLYIAGIAMSWLHSCSTRSVTLHMLSEAYLISALSFASSGQELWAL